MAEVYLSLGSNVGNRQETLERAITLIAQQAGRVVCRSSFIETEPWGFSSSHPFLNACIQIETELEPHQLLEILQAIERELGRTTKSINREYHDRPIDIDILTYDNITLNDPDLIIPHPLMLQRDFVMKPLYEIGFGHQQP